MYVGRITQKFIDQCSVACWSRNVVVTWKGSQAGSKTESKAGTVRHPARHHRDFPMIALEEVCSRARSRRLFSYKTVSTVASSRLLLEKRRYLCKQISVAICFIERFVARNHIVSAGAMAQQPRLYL